MSTVTWTLALALALAGAPGCSSQEAERVTLPVVIESKGVTPCTSDLGYTITLTTFRTALRDLELSTVLRGPRNQTCGDPKSVVDPMIDDAIAKVAAAHPELVHAAPKLEARDCSVFEKGGPHFNEEGRQIVARQIADWLQPRR